MKTIFYRRNLRATLMASDNKKRYPNSDLLVGISTAVLFIIIGVTLVYWGWYFYNDIQSIRKKGIKTVGAIIRYERRGPSTTNNLSDIITVPIVQFQTRSGQSFIIEGTVDDSTILQNIHKSGGELEIIYDSKTPKHAVINRFAELWFAPIMLWTIGVGFISVPPFTLWRHYKS